MVEREAVGASRRPICVFCWKSKAARLILLRRRVFGLKLNLIWQEQKAELASGLGC